MRVIRLGRALESLLAGGLLACSSATPPPVANVPASSAAPADAEGRAEPEPEPELTPVSAPENLLGIATLRAPAQTLDTLLGWMDVGLDWRALVGSSPAGQFLPILDLNAPIDAVVTLDPKDRNRLHTYSAISVGLSSRASALEVFRSLNFPIEELGRGLQLVHPSPDSTCFVAPALGQAKVRLVCGQDRESVELLAPYLARGIPSASTGDAALHVEIKAEAAWRTYGDKTQYLTLGVPMLLGELSTGNVEFDAALGEAARAAVDEISLLLEDLKDVRLDVRLQNEPAQLSLVLGSDLRGSRSWVARAFTQGEALASVAPEPFWKLPLDADQAAYRSKSDPELLRRAYELVERLAQSGLAQLGASAATQRDWPVALEQALLVAGPAVTAHGPVPERMLGNAADARDKLRASIGYTLIGIDDEANSYTGLLERTLRLYEDASLRKGLAKQFGVDISKLPKLQTKRGPARLPDSHLYQLDLPSALYIPALGKGSKDADPKRLSPVPLVVVTCRDGQRTWIAISSYSQLAEDRLAGVLSSASSEATLAQRSGLEPLQRDRSLLAGFWTLSGLASGVSFGKGGPKKFFASLGPSDVPILLRTRSQARGPSAEAEVDIPARVFRDAAAHLLPKQR